VGKGFQTMQEEGLKEPVSWYCNKFKSLKYKVEK
jgi:hypothetical protein